MKAAFLTALVLLTGPAMAGDAQVFATYGEFSGSLPPPYAWEYNVSFASDHQVHVQFCKGYVTEGPGCFALDQTLTDADFAALQKALTPLAADLAAHPAGEDPMPPVGGGSVFGKLIVDGAEVALPAFPLATDAPRVAAVIAVLRQYTPAGAVDAAKAKAVQP